MEVESDDSEEEEEEDAEEAEDFDNVPTPPLPEEQLQVIFLYMLEVIFNRPISNKPTKSWVIKIQVGICLF